MPHQGINTADLPINRASHETQFVFRVVNLEDLAIIRVTSCLDGSYAILADAQCHTSVTSDTHTHNWVSLRAEPQDVPRGSVDAIVWWDIVRGLPRRRSTQLPSVHGVKDVAVASEDKLER